MSDTDGRLVLLDEGELPAPFFGAGRFGPTPRMVARPTHRWWVLVTVLSGLFATGLTITVLTAAVPFIARDFGASTAALSLVVSAPFVFRSVFVPAFGKLGDRFGRRRVWLVGFGASTTFSLLCGFAPNVSTLIAFRAGAAIAGAAVIPSSLALISHAFEPDERVKALGWWSATIAVSPLTGVIVGGFVVQALSWRWLFFGQFPFGVLAFVLGLVVLRESRGERARFDLAGTGLSVLGIGCLVLFLNRGPTGAWAWDAPGMVIAAGLAVLGLVAFVVVELRSRAPVFPVQYFRGRRFAGAVGAMFFANFAYIGGFFITSLMLADGRLFGYSPAQVSLGVSPRAASLGVMGPIGGYLSARYGGRRMAVLGMAMIVASMVALALVTDNAPYAAILPGLVLSGWGLGLVGPPSAATVTNEADPADLAAVSGALNMGASIGSSMGIATMQAVVSIFAATPAHPGAGAYSAAFGFAAVTSVIGIAAAASLGPGRGRRATR